MILNFRITKNFLLNPAFKKIPYTTVYCSIRNWRGSCDVGDGSGKKELGERIPREEIEDDKT